MGTDHRFCILGPLRVVGADGEEVPISGARERALLVRLLMDVGSAVPESQLLEELWPEASATSRGSLQVRVSSLRRQLRGLANVVRSGGGYRLETDPETVDAVRFESLVEESATALPTHAVELLREALDLWVDPPLAELDGTPAEVHRSHLELVAQDARTRLGRSLAEAGRPEAAVAVLGQEWRLRPLDESVAAPLVRALYAAGRAAEAVETHHRTVRALSEQGLNATPAFRSLVTEVLRHEVPPPAPTSTSTGPTPPRPRATTLRRPTSEFLGRTDDLADAVRTVRDDGATLLTLWGPGGVGKTRLALEVVALLEGELDEAPVLVDATQADTAEQLHRLVHRAAGLSERADPLHDLLEALRSRRLLVLLDNAEHLLDATADLAEVLAAARGPQVLVTSRAVLGLAHEHVQPVMPWPVEAGSTDLSAVDFLRARAAAMGVRSLDEGDEPALRAVAARLDGLPLALELAAARLRALSPAELADQLDAHVADLGTLRNLPARQRSLHAMVEWSVGLLDDATCRLLVALGHFAGPARPLALWAVAGAEDRQRLSVLIDHALVELVPRADGGSAYGVLETLRTWARARTDDADRARLEARHAAHFLAEAEEIAPLLLTGRQAEATARLDEQRADLERALATLLHREDLSTLRTMVLALCRWWWGGGESRTAVRWLKHAAALPDDSRDEVRATALLAAAAASVGDRPLADESWARASALADRMGATREEVPELLEGEWFVAALDGGPTGAVGLSRAATELHRRAGREVLAAEMHVRTALARLGSGDPEGAERLTREALDMLVPHGPRWEQASVLNNLAHLAMVRGDGETALAEALASLEVYHRLPFARDRWVAWETLMSIRTLRGELDLARAAGDRALREATRSGDVDTARRVRVELAEVDVEAGAYAAAARLLLGLPLDEVGDALRWQLGAVAARLLTSAEDQAGAGVAAAVADSGEPDPVAEGGERFRAALALARTESAEADLQLLATHLRVVASRD